MMKIVCISDTHNHHEVLNGHIPDGDVLIHGGDIAIHGSIAEIQNFIDWFCLQPHPYKIFVGGNHDGALEHSRHLITIPENIIYLENNLVTIEELNIWGSPVSPPYRSFGFMWEDEQRKRLYTSIPTCDILINHSPAFGHLDKVIEGQHVGCKFLYKAIEQIRPRLVISGHIHEGYGTIMENNITYVNAAIMNRYYQPVNKPIVIEL